MKLKTLLFIFTVALLASCSTAYKSGQTPDDLYYSKGKVIKEDSSDRYRHSEQSDYSYEDTRIRLSSFGPRWRTLDDYYDYNCRYTPYSYGYNYGYYYNPYYYPYPVYSHGTKYINPKSTVVRTINLNTYNNNTVSTYVPGRVSTRLITVRGYTPANNNRPVSGTGRSYTPDKSSSSNNSNSSSSSNTHTNSSNSNSGSSSSGSVSRPSRGN